MFPWHVDVADQWTSQPQLPAGGSDQPAPAIGCCRVSRADGSPTERLLEEAERVLDGEAAQIPAPQHAQVSRQWTADPGQPQRPRWQLFVGQALDLDAHHTEGSVRRTSHVEIGPSVDTDFAIGSVDQSGRLLRLAMRVFFCQPKWLTMQARSPAAWMPFGGAIHHAVFGQAHQEVRVDGAVCQGLQVIPTVERDHWAWCTGGLRLTHSGDLVERHLRRGLRRRSATLHVQRQHPTASYIWHGHQPLIGPGRHDAALGPAWQRPILPGPIGAGACGWTRPVGPVNHPQWSAIDHSRVCQRPGKSVRSAVTSTDPSASASQVLDQRRRNVAVKLSRTSVLRWAAVKTASTSSNKLS